LNLISITGPESTGKSSLAQALADHYGADWVPEYAREYLAFLDRPYEFDDIARIAEGQLQKEKQMSETNPTYLFCDTDMLVCKIWSEFKFNRVDPLIDRMMSEHRYDLYLLCDIDIPWAADPLREHPDRRRELYDLYFSTLKALEVPFEVISGQGEERTLQAILAIDKTFKVNNLQK